jgi:hypothetical protein
MISIGLNLLLGVMLFCGLLMGVRLEKRLRVLRDSHLDFAKAVSELDQAADRTETSLASLRAGTEAARTDLAARIDQARLACQRLEQLTTAAEKTLDRPLPLSAPAPAPVHAPADTVAAFAARLADAPSALRSTASAMRAAAPAPLRPMTAPPVRSRAMVDDDLFESGPRREQRPLLAAFAGGRR